MPNVNEIVKAWLVEHGYGGLCLPCEDCGCGLDDLIPCGDLNGFCKAGHCVTRNGVRIVVPGKRVTILDEKLQDPSEKLAKSEEALRVLHTLHDALDAGGQIAHYPITLESIQRAIREIEKEGE